MKKKYKCFMAGVTLFKHTFQLYIVGAQNKTQVREVISNEIKASNIKIHPIVVIPYMDAIGFDYPEIITKSIRTNNKEAIKSLVKKLY